MDRQLLSLINIKEKLIGKTLEVSFDLHGVLDDFLEKRKDNNSELVQFFSDNTSLIEEIYQKADYKNLRTLKQIIFDFKRIFEHLPEKAKDKPKFLQEVLKVLIYFSINIRCANMLAKDIYKLKEAWEYPGMQEKFDYKEKIPGEKQSLLSEEEIKKLVSLKKIVDESDYLRLSLSLYKPILGLFWWSDFFDKGIIDKNKRD